MSGAEVALDANVAITVLNDTGDAGTWARQFARLYLPVPVVGELRFGALNSHRVAGNLSRIEGLVARCEIIPVTLATADVYARVRIALKRKGRPIPPNDIWIAAACIEHAIPLATLDAHFLEIEDLQVVRR